MLDLIYNETSGSGKCKKIIAKISEALKNRNIKHRLFPTKAKKHATELAKKLSAEGSTDIIAVGGDGTVHEVLNGIDTEKVNFGIIPAGSGNDFIETAKIPLDPMKALEIILTREPKPTDYLDCAGVRGINIIATGIDVEILKRCAKFKVIKGKLQYLLSLIISLFKFEFYNFDTLIDGKREEKEALIVACGNGKVFGGGIQMCPEAQIDDGLMDFVICNKMKKSKIPSAFVKLMKGKILQEPFTEFSRQTHVEVCFDKKTTVNVDGELYEDLPFDVKIVNNELKMYRPQPKGFFRLKNAL